MGTNRSAKWMSDYSEVSRTDTQGRVHVSTTKMACEKSGKIVGFPIDILANLAAYMSLFLSAVPT
tara:strand:+ start:344 stop:538 length:195 start_codon:yes stop_codon:yes gene_type:complete